MLFYHIIGYVEGPFQWRDRKKETDKAKGSKGNNVMMYLTIYQEEVTLTS